jgi:hypothetical protein
MPMLPGFAGVYLTEQEPAETTHVLLPKLPEARGACENVTVPPFGATGLPKPESVTVAVHVVAMFTGSVAGEQETEVEEGRRDIPSENGGEMLPEWSVSPAYFTVIPMKPEFPALSVKFTLHAPAAAKQLAGLNVPLPTGLWENETLPPVGVIVGPGLESVNVAVHVVTTSTAVGFGSQLTAEVDARGLTVREKYCEVVLAE